MRVDNLPDPKTSHDRPKFTIFQSVHDHSFTVSQLGKRARRRIRTMMGKIASAAGVAVVLGLYFHFSGEGFDPKSIAGKRVLITGASSGIGEQLAYQYSALGARVFITARRAKLLETVAKKCKELGAEQVEYMTSDLAVQRDRDKVMTEVSGRLGGLDHLIFNHAIASSGLWLGSRGNVSTLLTDLKVNFISYVDLASQALPALATSKGAIGVVSSIAGKIPIAVLSSYSADKFALHGFFGSLRVELHHRNAEVSITTCIFGPVDTDLLKLSEERKEAVRKNVLLGTLVTSTAKDAATAMLTGVATRQKEIYHGKVAKVLVMLHQLFPGFIENRLGAEPTLSRIY